MHWSVVREYGMERVLSVSNSWLQTILVEGNMKYCTSKETSCFCRTGVELSLQTVEVMISLHGCRTHEMH